MNGGNYGLNVEVLAGDKTLTPDTDDIYQFLDEGGADRIISLDTGGTQGSRFIIKHNGDGNDAHFLDIQEYGGSIDKIYARGVKEFIFDGTNWLGVSTGAVPIDANCGITIGEQSRAYARGVALGSSWSYYEGVGLRGRAYYRGVAIGYDATAEYYSVAIGATTDAGSTEGVVVGRSSDMASAVVALGYNCCSKKVCLGYLTENSRYLEIAMNIDAETDQENQIVICTGYLKTTNNTPRGIYGDVDIQASSALSFKMMVTARDDTTGDCAAYLFEGIIKRDGAGNTTLVDSNKVVLHEDDATWDCSIAADDTNEELAITMTGDASNDVRWAMRLDGVETHF